MSYKLSRSDIRFLEPVYKIGNVLAILPFYNFKKSSLICPNISKIYVYFFVVLEIIGTVWTVFIRTSSYDDICFFTMTFGILGTCDTLILGMLKISLMLGICCFKSTKWMNFNNKMQMVDKKLQMRNRWEKNIIKNPASQLAFCNFVFIFIVLYGLTVRTIEKGVHTLKVFALYEFNGYYTFYVEILIWNLALALRDRYRRINQQLAFVKSEKNPFNSFIRIGKVSRLLGDIVRLFNEIFGWPLVFITGRAVIKILITCIFFTNTLQMKNLGLKSRLEISSLMQTTIVLVSMSILILSCHAAKSECLKSIRLCHKLREKYPNDSDEQKGLKQLAKLMDRNKVEFTAADFFQIDRSTLFGILSTTTTYLIVTIQFNQNLHHV